MNITKPEQGFGSTYSRFRSFSIASPRHGRACPGHPRLSFAPRARKQGVDARDKRGHDDGEADSI
jgi:hypothetical protein